jgi:hypothetical protein
MTCSLFFSLLLAVSMRQADIASKAAFTAWRASSESPGTDIELKLRGFAELSCMARLLLLRIDFMLFRLTAAKHSQEISSAAPSMIWDLRPAFTPLYGSELNQASTFFLAWSLASRSVPESYPQAALVAH